MLTKIKLDNFKSFKNKTTVDLTKTNYTILPQNVADNGVLKGCIFVRKESQFGYLSLYVWRQHPLFSFV